MFTCLIQPEQNRHNYFLSHPYPPIYIFMARDVLLFEAFSAGGASKFGLESHYSLLGEEYES